MTRALLLRAGLVLAFTGPLGAALTQTAFAQAPSRAEMQNVRAACEADIRAACPGVRPGGGRIIQCIKDNPDKISAPCKDALAAAKVPAAP